MNIQQYFNSESNRKALRLGLPLFLLAAIIGLTVILNWQFTARIIQIENAALTNNSRLTAIENVLNQVSQQLKVQKSQAEMSKALSGESTDQPAVKP